MPAKLAAKSPTSKPPTTAKASDKTKPAAAEPPGDGFIIRKGTFNNLSRRLCAWQFPKTYRQGMIRMRGTYKDKLHRLTEQITLRLLTAARFHSYKQKAKGSCVHKRSLMAAVRMVGEVILPGLMEEYVLCREVCRVYHNSKLAKKDQAEVEARREANKDEIEELLAKNIEVYKELPNEEQRRAFMDSPEFDTGTLNSIRKVHLKKAFEKAAKAAEDAVKEDD